jgi:hypothetical protein
MLLVLHLSFMSVTDYMLDDRSLTPRLATSLATTINFISELNFLSYRRKKAEAGRRPVVYVYRKFKKGWIFTFNIPYTFTL